ncbi:MAG: hypothetical protein M1427_06605 [Candidatus Thermoplasmatota archaeon]|jgi:hypothetical protein|nr:hypothetical protein [Candidatus Thermoplasmatota archaeon]
MNRCNVLRGIRKGKVQSPEEFVRELIAKNYWGSVMGGRKSERPMIVTPHYGNYGHLTMVTIEINGSPPKGAILYDIEHDAFFYIGSGIVKDLCPRGKSEFPAAITRMKLRKFIESLDLDEYREMGSKTQRVKVIMPSIRNSMEVK